MFRSVGLLLLVLTVSGCHGPGISYHPNAVQVTRETNWKKWEKFKPEQTLEFGKWAVRRPDSSASQGKGKVSLGRLDRVKHRLTSSLEFTLDRSGTPVASVRAHGKYKLRSTQLPVLPGRVKSEDHDQFYGDVEMGGEPVASFELTGFTSDQVGTRATGVLRMGGSQLDLEEVAAPWYDSRDGFAGADFYLRGERVAQVVRGDRNPLMSGPGESFWVSPELPEHTQTVIAATSAALLLAQRPSPVPETD